MKIENKIKYNCVKEALIRWVLGTDGQNGAPWVLCDTIPWGEEIEEVISWNDVYGDFRKAFGSRTDENGELWDVAKILTNADELERFMSFIIEKTNKVMIVYQGIIDRANKLGNDIFVITIHKFVGVENNVAKYEQICHYSGNNLTTLANEVYDKLKVSDWENDDFIDAVHFGLYNNHSTVFNSNHLNEHYLHLEVKKCV
jgi:hypothetical protein